MPNGPGEILDLIRHGHAVTRGDVLDRTGLSRVTVSQRIDALLSAGMIVEDASASLPTGGRPRRSLAFNVDQARVLAAAVDTTHTQIAVTDLSGRVIGELTVDVPVLAGPVDALDAIGKAMGQLMADLGIVPTQLCGAGISLPGPMNPETGRPSEPPIMPGWDAFPVAAHIQGSLPGVPILTANDADAAALGEYAAGFSTVRSLYLLKVSTGIGSGVVIDGRSYTGADGGAGDIGHIRVSPDSDVLCACGGRGCLASIASGRAVAQELTRLGHPAESGRDVGRLLRGGNAEASALTQQAGRHIGEVMATVVCLLNPEVVLVGGELASASLLSGIRETLYHRALPRATRHMALQLGRLGANASVVGLTRLVVDHVFSVERVNERLRR